MKPIRKKLNEHSILYDSVFFISFSVTLVCGGWIKQHGTCQQLNIIIIIIIIKKKTNKQGENEIFHGGGRQSIIKLA